jgi:hypothetical protein
MLREFEMYSMVTAEVSVSPAIKCRCLGELQEAKINIPKEKPAGDMCFLVCIMMVSSLVRSNILITKMIYDIFCCVTIWKIVRFHIMKCHECQLMESLSACVDRDDIKIRGRTGGSSTFAEYENVPMSSLKKVT